MNKLITETIERIRSNFPHLGYKYFNNASFEHVNFTDIICCDYENEYMYGDYLIDNKDNCYFGLMYIALMRDGGYVNIMRDHPSLDQYTWNIAAHLKVMQDVAVYGIPITPSLGSITLTADMITTKVDASTMTAPELYDAIFEEFIIDDEDECNFSLE